MYERDKAAKIKARRKAAVANCHFIAAIITEPFIGFIKKPNKITPENVLQKSVKWMVNYLLTIHSGRRKQTS